MKLLKKYPMIIVLGTILLIYSCKNDYTPKPPGYFRISLPEKAYVLFDSTCPYRFEYPTYATVKPDTGDNSEAYWINVHYPAFKGQIHISYKKLNQENLFKFLEDSRTLAYKHTVKADAIEKEIIIDTSNNVYGTYFDIKGNAASPAQFYLTDSSRHFIRGSLYFNVVPNKDSLQPVINFVEKDIFHLIETFEWKNVPLKK